VYEGLKPENKELLEGFDTVKAFRVVWDISVTNN
jgi:hypothetical protein